MDQPRHWLTRRALLQRSSTVATLGLAAHWPLTSSLRRSLTTALSTAKPVDGAFVDPAFMQRLAMRALDAAKSAGAQYADVRLTRTLQQSNSGLSFDDSETIGIGVRTLVNGAWGFAATSYWTDDEAVRIGQVSAAQAKANAVGVIKPIELAPVSAVTGSWVMPVKEDPFLIPWETKLNIIQGTTVTARQQLPLQSRVGGSLFIPLMDVSCYRQERALATSDGTYVTQTVYRTSGNLELRVTGKERWQQSSAAANGIEETGRGWEIFAAARLIDQIPRMLDEAEADAALPVKPVDVGQYDVICDGSVMASLVNNTFGHATALDVALGYEANAGGTSYLGPDPSTWLGQTVANPLVTIIADRSSEGGLSTVKWDDDGIVPRDFPIVTNGKLIDYQTTREFAPQLSPWYTQQHQSVQSHGCASSTDARNVALLMTPNLSLAPAASGPTLDAMMSGMSKGLAIVGGDASTDFQAKNGTLSGGMYEIKNGKRTARLSKAAILFSAPEIWKNITAIGGPDTVVPTPMYNFKGQPGQETMHTVRSAAVAVKNASVIDITRKA